ncbi:MAG: amidohydrolase family protein [Yoonia sp.]
MTISNPALGALVDTVRYAPDCALWTFGAGALMKTLRLVACFEGGIAMFIDTHLHLIARDRISYPWLQNVPALDRDWTFEAYETVARRIGITGALHMECDCAAQDIAAENRFVAQMMMRDDSLLIGGISAARPEDEGFAPFLDRCDAAQIKGFRRVLHVMPDDLSRDDAFRANIRLIGGRGLPFDICVAARQLDIAAELVDACDNTTFVLDHCGVPDIAGGGYADWSSRIADLARRPHVNAKISGVSAYAGPDWTLDHLRPYVEHIIDSFGWDRVVWGSDSPVCTLHASLEQWMAATQALIAGASVTERGKLAAGNARRIWDLARD